MSVSAKSDEPKQTLLSWSSIKNIVNEKKVLKIEEEKKSTEEKEAKKGTDEKDVKKSTEEKESKKSQSTDDTWSTESATWVTHTGNSLESNDNERRKVELRLKRDINAYIIESYKAQWNKIIKDLNMKLSKTIPEPEERKLALGKIQESLKSRLDKTEEMGASESKKEILQEFLKHLIQLLDKKIDEIEK